jgi:hypothetical protein
MCADTQETILDEKQYSEKIAILEDLSYPLAIGGAGVDEIIEAFSQELMERVRQSKPATKRELESAVKASILKVYKEDVPVSVISRQYRTQHFIIAAKPSNDNFVIFLLKGRRVYTIRESVIIGFATTTNKLILQRLFRAGLSMQQAVMLAVFLVSQSKALDLGVGGDTRIAVVVDDGASIDDPEYIENSERRVGDFLKLSDELFLNSVDMSISPTNFDEKLVEFTKRLKNLRETYLRWSAAHSINRAMSDPNYRGDAYAKEFPGMVTTVKSDGTFAVREDSPEEIERRRQMIEAAKQDFNRMAGAELEALIRGRGDPEYIGRKQRRFMERADLAEMRMNLLL